MISRNVEHFSGSHSPMPFPVFELFLPVFEQGWFHTLDSQCRKLNYAAELRSADDVVETLCSGWFLRRGEIRRQVLPRRMWAFFVILATPDSAQMVECFSATMTNLFRHSNFSVGMNRSTCAHRFGDSAVFRFTMAPLDVSTPSN